MEDLILSDKARMQIFQILCEQRRIHFNSIAKLAGISSNKLSYHLNLMKEKNFVVNEDGEYSLSIEAQRLIPYFSQIFKKEVGVLPVVLGIVRKEGKILLIQRRKMPYQGHWGLFGGKQISGETIPETIEREVLEEANLKVKFAKYNAVVYERLRENDRFKHSFLLIITSLTADSFDTMEQQEGKVAWFAFQDVLDNRVPYLIPSDVLFLKRYAEKDIAIDEVVMEEQGENLVLK